MDGKPDYDAGDLVECIDASPRNGLATGVRLGAMYRVERVQPKPIDMPHSWGVILVGIRSLASSGSFWADRFRKVRKADDSFTSRIRACKPINRSIDA